MTEQVAKLEPLRSKPRRRHRRWVKRVLLGAGGTAIAGALVYGWLPKPVVVDSATAHYAPLEVTVDADGRTRVRDRFVVSAPLGGTLARIELDPGDTVVANAVVARLQPPDPAMLDDRTRVAAEARLTAALAHQRQADAAIARSQVARAAATREAERARALFRAGAVSGAERERLELADDLAASDLAEAQLVRAAAVADLASARAVLGLGVRGAATTIPVVAPSSGQVLRVLRDSAGPVAQGTPLLELGDPRAIEVVVDVLSSDAARIAVGAPVSIEAWGGDAVLRGHVRRVEPSAFTRVSALGIEEQRVNVVVEIDAPPATLGDGFRVDTRIVTWHGDKVLAIPASAVFRDHNRWAVYAVVDGRAHLQPIEVGHRGRIDVEVLGGLADGAVVIVHPGDRIVPERRVESR